jgi:phosphopantothenoylcysteine decarboxylase/phosphopantothenate--cysteine ligase
MKSFLLHKQIVLGITGGIAAYKSADLVRRLREAGAEVRVVMTTAAKEFITPLTMQALSGHPVHDDLFDLQAENAMGHIELARWADLIVVAPATADFLSRMRWGEANDLLTTICLVTDAPIALAPAMNQGMWKNSATLENVQALQQKGFHIFGPAEGQQACGEFGLGRMMEPLDLVEKITTIFSHGLLSGQHVLITAGPTQEAIDPVRYISNGSSGKMGYALAQACVEAGAAVTLVSGPVSLAKIPRVKHIDVVSAKEMFNAVMQEVASADIFLSVAAVADYRVKDFSSQKIKKQDTDFILHLERTEDIVASVAALEKKHLFVVGFAAETENLIEHAAAKLKNKKLDMIVANLVGAGVGIGNDENAVTVLWDDQQKVFEKMPKQKLARELVSVIARSALRDEAIQDAKKELDCFALSRSQ